MNEDSSQPEYRAKGARARGPWLRVLAAFGILLLVTLVILWTQRKPIAENFIGRQLAAKDVQARYTLARISPGTQRIENLALGDPRHPDLTARSVEVILGYSGIVPKVVEVRAEGVRLYGRMVDGELSLGEVDKLLAGGGEGPLSLPDLRLRLTDARARIDTPAGPVGLKLDGGGNLTDGFAGKLAVVGRDLELAGCAAPLATAWLDLAVADGSPHVTGPVRASTFGCPGQDVAAVDLAMRIDARADRQLARFTGQAEARAGGLDVPQARFAAPRLDLHFDGTTRDMGGRFALRAENSELAGAARTEELRSEGSWTWKGGAGRVQGDLSARQLALGQKDAVRGLLATTRDTPVGPLVARLADAVDRASRSNVARLAYSLSTESERGELRLSRFAWDAATGARLAMSQGGQFRYGWPDNRWALTGSVTSQGGGLPDAALRLTERADGGFGGQLFLDPYAAGTARLSVEPVRFIARPGGSTRVLTRLRLDGPVAGGMMRGLDLPVDVRFSSRGWSLNPGCTPVRLASLRHSALSADNVNLTLCGRGGALLADNGAGIRGGAVIRALRLPMRLGSSPALLTARQAELRVEDAGFALSDARLALGSAESPVVLEAAELLGRGATGGMAGQGHGISARIGSVPLLVRDGRADWSFDGAALALAGELIVHDAETPDRFNPLAARDFALRLADGDIHATGTLTLPTGGTPIASLDIRHDLGRSSGRADIIVDALRFGPALQPEDVTRLALGVVANVRGAISGRGQVRWTGESVSSDGEFVTENTDLAAAFGPVEGLSTRIRFTDLIGLVTAPGQVATIRSVNPGVEATDGRITYALLPGQRVRVDGGYWPFSGGDLSLLPTVLDFSADVPRHLTFRVLGLNAGSFIQKMELENISATGTFDGLLPMVFDATGGRIVNGVLIARQEGRGPLIIDDVARLDVPCDPDRRGGNLSYIGQVSNEDLGTMGSLAFDALKDLQFKCLSIWMDGAIDGEVVTRVLFNGINRGRLSRVPGFISRQLVNLPFIFNIRIEAPFRGLLQTAVSFSDPSMLIRQQMEADFIAAQKKKLAVQPAESDTGISGEGK